MSKLIKFNDDARQSLVNGINILANAVKCTLGPEGRTVLVEEYYGPHITKDGVTVAKAIELEDKFENMGVQLVKQVASKTCDDVGDGTTTSTVLTQAIVTEGLKAISSGASPRKLKSGIDTAVTDVVNYIKLFSQSAEDKIEEVATVSANNDPEIGKIVAEAMRKATKNGVINVEEGKTPETIIETVEGMRFDRGYSSQYFVTDNENLKCELEDPCIIVCNKKISDVKTFLPILEAVATQNQSVLIIAEEVDTEALNTFVMNKIRAGLKICVVRSPGFGYLKEQMIHDIAILTGARVYGDNAGTETTVVTPDIVGGCSKAIITKNSTSLIGCYGYPEAIAERVKEIKSQLENATEQYEIDQCKDRLSKLDGSVAIIKVGAVSEVEMQEKKDRIDDALCAVRAALEEGIVPGGGITYIRAHESLETPEFDEDVKIGYNIVKKAILYPFKQIISNSGECPDVILDKLHNNNKFYGYNAKTKEFGDMISDFGVIDPAKVTRIALENAASVAELFLTTDCVIVDNVVENQEAKSFFV